MLKLESQLLTFEFSDKLIKDVDCNIEIEDESHWNKILITTFDSSVIQLQDKKDGIIVIPSKNISGDFLKIIEMKGVSIRDFNINFSNVTTIKFALYPKEVFIRESFEHKKRKRSATITYLINKAPMFAPWTFYSPDKNGNIIQKKGEVLSIETVNGHIINSNTSFTFHSKNGHLELDEYQVLTTKLNSTKLIEENIINNINPHVEDIMLMMSFLQDSKVHSVNWNADYSNKTIRHYKSNNIKATDIEKFDHYELIDREYIKDFMSLSLKTLSKSIYKKEIKNCIQSILIRRKGYIELTFLSFFQALESLILAYKRSNNLEFILEKSTFEKLKKAIGDTIKNEIPDLKNQRGKIKNKLNELNRLSLKESTELFLSEFKIKTDDTWPLFDNKAHGITGLSTIRNVLIHGDLLPQEQLINIAIALEHLRVILSRCIFCILGWDVSKTKISEDYLMKNHFLFRPTELQNSMNEINNHFKNKM